MWSASFYYLAWVLWGKLPTPELWQELFTYRLHSCVELTWENQKTWQKLLVLLPAASVFATSKNTLKIAMLPCPVWLWDQQPNVPNMLLKVVMYDHLFASVFLFRKTFSSRYYRSQWCCSHICSCFGFRKLARFSCVHISVLICWTLKGVMTW